MSTNKNIFQPKQTKLQLLKLPNWIRVFREQLVWLYVNFFCQCYDSKPGGHFAPNLDEFSVARVEELEGESVNNTAISGVWIANQSARKTLSTALVYTKYW